MHESRPSLTARGPTVIQDSQSLLPLSRLLKDGDLILLLTPGVVPGREAAKGDPKTVPSDPFEPLGRTLAKYHPWVRHVPYIPRNGITGTHVVHIRLATTIVFVISGPPSAGQPSQVALAEITREVCEHRPQIVVACCNIRELGPLEATFPAVIQLPNFQPAELEAAAGLIFGESKKTPTTGPNVQNLLLAPKPWKVEVWDEHRDVAPAFELWCQCFPEAYHLGRFQFQSLLQRDGYAMHYVVREPGTLQMLGFCATYTTYADGSGDRLVGSVAALFVRPSYRQRGVGRSLHDHALRQLGRTRGVGRLKLGSTFPRLFYGLPLEFSCDDWFRRRGWPMHGNEPGAGQQVSDWFLRFEDWPETALMPSGLDFRPCEIHEFDQVLELVERETRKKDSVGWYDQYAKLANSMNIRDIVLGLDGGRIVATALTYAKNTGSPVADDLPWAGTIADDCGGVTCVCIMDDIPDTNKKDAIMIRLLDSCIRLLAEQGMKKLLIDAMRGGDEGFQSMGFQKWARYRDVWRTT